MSPSETELDLEPGTQPKKWLKYRTLWLVALVIYWTALFIGTHMPPKASFVLVHGLDKVLHFLAYAGLAFVGASYWQIAGGYLRAVHFRFLWIGLAIFGAVDELLQIPVGRDGNIYDWFADIAGVLMGIFIFMVARFVFPKIFWRDF